MHTTAVPPASRRGRGRRRGERGAETLEFVCCIALLLLVAGGCEQAAALLRLQAAAESDARTLARARAACDSLHPLDLHTVDPAAEQQGATVRYVERPGDPTFRTEVTIPAPAPLDVLGIRPGAVVVMQREPGCP